MAKINALKRLPMILPTLILEAASVTTKIRGSNIFPAKVAIGGMTISQSLFCRRRLKRSVFQAARMAKISRATIRKLLISCRLRNAG